MHRNTSGPSMRKLTHLAEIALVLQEAPGQMLTFSQLMDKLGPFSEDRKSAENNARVCLSTNKCFVKIPVIPGSDGCKRNYWKLDLSWVTAKMVRRHFKGILEFFPELASMVENEGRGGPRHPRSPEPVRVRCEMKFSGPFSIESLLQRDNPSPSLVPPSAMKMRSGWVRLPLLLQDSGSNTHHGLPAGASFLTYTATFPAPYCTSSPCSYITNPVPSLTPDAHYFQL